jgi:N-acetylglucosaminylphosphatidylinositol deacetylase family protein
MENKRILVFAPHPDDEILGCGGTIARYIKEGCDVYVCIVTKGMPPLFKNEELNQLNQEDAKRSHKFLGINKTFFLDFPAADLESVKRFELNGRILDVTREICPEIAFIPHIGDMQKDHQIVVDACMVALRPKYFPQVKRILSYETLSETDWNIPNVSNAFIPNVFVNIEETLEIKKKALSFFNQQVCAFPDARSVEAIEALARHRGALMHWKAAEAFMLIRDLR